MNWSRLVSQYPNRDRSEKGKLLNFSDSICQEKTLEHNLKSSIAIRKYMKSKLVDHLS